MEFLRLYAVAPAKPAPAKPAPEKPAPIPVPESGNLLAQLVRAQLKGSKQHPDLSYFENSNTLGSITKKAKVLWQINKDVNRIETIKLVNEFMKENGYDGEPLPSTGTNIPLIENMYRGDAENERLGDTEMLEGKINFTIFLEKNHKTRNSRRYFWLLLLLWAWYKDENEDDFLTVEDELDPPDSAKEEEKKKEAAADKAKKAAADKAKKAAADKAKKAAADKAKENQKKYPYPGAWDEANEPTLENLIKFAKKNPNPELLLYQAHKLYEDKQSEPIDDIKKAISTFLNDVNMDELNKMYTQEAKNTLLGTSTMKWGYTSKQNILGNKLNLKLIHNYRSDQENYYWHILFLWAAHQDEANYKKSPELTEIALPDYIEADILVKHVDPEKENVKYFLEKMKVDFTLNTLKDDWPGMVKAIDMYNGTVENTQLGSNEMGVLHRTINFAEHGPKITTADARFPVYLLWLHMINDSLQPE